MGDELNHLYEDTSGTRWIGLRHNGLLEIDSNKNTRRYFKHDQRDPYFIFNDSFSLNRCILMASVFYDNASALIILQALLLYF